MTQEDLGLFLGRPSETVEEATRAGEEAAERQRQRDGRPRRRAAAEPTLTPQDILNLLAAGEISASEAVDRITAIFEGQGTTAEAALQNATQTVNQALGVSTQPGISDVAGGPTVPGVASTFAEGEDVPFEPFDPFLAQETEPQQVFLRSLQERGDFGGLSPFAQQGLRSQFGDVFQRFLINTLTGPVSGQEGGERFFDFLGQARPNIQQLQGGLGQIGSIFGGENIGPFARQQEIRNFFGPESDPNFSRALSASLTPALAQTNPLFRGALTRGSRTALQEARAIDPTLNPFTFFQDRGFF